MEHPLDWHQYYRAAIVGPAVIETVVLSARWIETENNTVTGKAPKDLDATTEVCPLPDQNRDQARGHTVNGYGLTHTVDRIWNGQDTRVERITRMQDRHDSKETQRKPRQGTMNRTSEIKNRNRGMRRRLYPAGTGTSDALLAHGINTGIQNKVRQKRGKHIKHNAAQDSYRKARHCKKQ